MTVSPQPSKIAACTPVVESGPNCSIMSAAKVAEADPEMGFRMAKGINSEENPRNFAIGETRLLIN